MIAYQLNLTGISAAQLEGFFVGWPDPPSPDTHLRILENSAHVVLALEGGRVIGFVSAISDGVLSVYISLLEVLPDHQGRGAGRELMIRMNALLEGLYMNRCAVRRQRATILREAWVSNRWWRDDPPVRASKRQTRTLNLEPRRAQSPRESRWFLRPCETFAFQSVAKL